MSNQFEQPENYRNRELSWLEFDYRVLSEARVFKYYSFQSG